MKPWLAVACGWGATGVIVAAPPPKQETYERVEALALAGNPDAQTLAGRTYEYGRLGQVDLAAAATMYLAAARAGDLVAIDGLVRLLASAQVDEAAKKATIEILRRAAQDGDRESRFGLACLLWNGVALPRDSAEAAQWLKAAAAQGDADAKLFADYLIADTAVQSAAELSLRNRLAGLKLGRASANFLRGFSAEHGWQTERDPIVAVQKYRLAAEADQPEALVRLAVILMEGDLAARDLPGAYVLLHRASEIGVEQAAQYLSQVRALMTADELDAASVKLVSAVRR